MSDSTFEIRILNNTGFQPDQIWLLGKGQSLKDAPAPAPAKEAFFKISPDGEVVLTDPDVNAHSSDFSIKLSDINPVAGKNFWSLKLPSSQGSRVYISIGRPLTLLVKTSSGITIQDPDPWKTSDPNFAVVYDKFEFSLTDKMYMDTTAVDFFGIPISLTANSLDENVDTTGLPQSRSTIIDTYSKHMTGKWQKLLLSYPPGSSQHASILRVVAPNKAVGSLWSKQNPPPSPENNTDSNFDPNYLDNHLTSIWENTGIKLQVDCTEVNTKKDDNGNNLPLTFKGTVSDKMFHFEDEARKEPPFKIAQPTTSEAFGGEGGSFHSEKDSKNKDIPPSPSRIICVRELTVAINTGLLPIIDDSLLQKAYFKKREADFYANPGNLADPDFNLFSKVTHAIPADGKTYPNSVSNKIYAFAYDDAAGQDGTLQVGINPESFITINLKNLGDLNLPDPDKDDNFFYDIAFSAPMKGGVGQVTTGENMQVDFPAGVSGIVKVSKLKSPIAIKYGPDKDNMKAYKVYMAMQAVYNEKGESLDCAFVCLDGFNSYQVNFPSLVP